MDETTLFLTILGMAAATYLPRLLPALYLASRSLPPLLVAWLRYVPVAVLAAMLLPTLVIQDGSVAPPVNNVYLWAAVPTLLMAWRTRSLFGSVLVGIATVALARLRLGL